MLAAVFCQHQPGPEPDGHSVLQAKCQLTCHLCQQRYGACIQCAGSSKCFLAFHPSCARNADLVMETVEPGSDYDTSEAESDSDKAPAQNTVSRQGVSLEENQATSNMPATASKGSQLKGTDPASADIPQRLSSSQGFGDQPADTECVETPSATDAVVSGEEVNPCANSALLSAPKRRRRHGAPVQEGTYIGGGRRMMCYCPKHSHMAQMPQGVLLQQAAVPAASLAAPLAALGAASLPGKAAMTHDAQPEAGQGSEQQQSAHQPGNAAEGLLPSCSGQPPAYQLPQHKPGCIRGVPFNHACRRGQREPDAIAAALAKRLFVAKTPYIIGAARRHDSQQLPSAQMHSTEEPFLETSTNTMQSAVVSRCQPAAKTQTQRFLEMQQTVGRRLTCGKSAIHGLGAFTKQPHKPGRSPAPV